MGSQYMAGFAGMVKLEKAVEIQLIGNHYPPAYHMVKPCIKAIENVTLGKWDKKVRYPISETKFKFATTQKIVEAFHLYDVIDMFYVWDEFSECYYTPEEMEENEF